MRKGFLSSGAALLLGAASALAQADAKPGQAPAPATTAPATLTPAAAPQPVPPGCGTPAACATDVLCPCPAPWCRPGRCWVSAEYLMWWTQGSFVPPLGTTGLPASPPACTAAIGQPGTAVLFGGHGINDDWKPGARFTVGGWLDDCRRCGLEASYFFLGSQSDDFFAASPGSPILARPFTDPLTGPCTQLVAFPPGVFPSVPGGAAGALGASLYTKFQGGDLNWLHNLRDCCNYRVDLLAGFRYLNLRERLTVRESILTGPGPAPLADTAFAVLDQFTTSNDFYGGQVGARAEWTTGRFFVRGTGKVALGDTHQAVAIAGATGVTPVGGATTVLPSGLLALPTNIGHYTRDRFSVVPELTAAAGYQVTDSLRAFVSYTFLYWTNVVRPGDVIDPVVNSTLVGTSVAPAQGPARPAFAFRDSDFWAQGIGFGLELRY